LDEKALFIGVVESSTNLNHAAAKKWQVRSTPEHVCLSTPSTFIFHLHPTSTFFPLQQSSQFHLHPTPLFSRI
jgi:hypothetical protein